MTGTLLSLGHGYSAQALARRLLPDGWTILGTTRTPEKVDALKSQGITPLLWGETDPLPALLRATHILASAAPTETGDPFLNEMGELVHAARPKWVGYLSTTGVYGDHGGGWVDEDTPLNPSTKRGRLRVLTERQWFVTGREANWPVHVFRLAGIYGPGRGPFAKVRAGTARRIIKPNQVFSRIHVEDIATTLAASIAQPSRERAYNVCDDDPAPPQDVIAHAAELLELPTPPDMPFDLAKASMSPMAVSFYAESKRVRNDRIKSELGVTLAYPSYRDGLPALLAAEAANHAQSGT